MSNTEEREEIILLRLIGSLIATINKLTDIISRLIQSSAENVQLTLITVSNNSSIKSTNMPNIQILLNPGQSQIDTIGLIDSDTGIAVVATFAKVSFVSSDPTKMSSTQDTTNPNQTKNAFVASGSGNLTIQADATYTDSKTGLVVTKSLQLVVPFTMAAAAAENVALTLIQGTPTPGVAAPAARPVAGGPAV